MIREAPPLITAADVGSRTPDPADQRSPPAVAQRHLHGPPASSPKQNARTGPRCHPLKGPAPYKQLPPLWLPTRACAAGR